MLTEIFTRELTETPDSGFLPRVRGRSTRFSSPSCLAGQKSRGHHMDLPQLQLGSIGEEFSLRFVLGASAIPSDPSTSGTSGPIRPPFMI